MNFYETCFFLVPLLSVRNQRSMEARSHLENVLVVWYLRWTTIGWAVLGKAHHDGMERDYGRRSSLGSGIVCYRTGPSFIGGRHFTQ